MRSRHTTRWLCTSRLHNKCSFESEQEFDDHMQISHKGTFTASQLPLLRNRSRVPTLVTFKQCPLCGYAPSEEESRKRIRPSLNEISPDQLEESSSNLIIKHLSNHLESLAITSLPWLDTVEDVRSEKIASETAENSTDSKQDGSPSTHRRLSNLTALDDESDDGDSLNWSNEDSPNNHSLREGSYEEEWSFVPRPDYYGHDRDPVLQPLLRRLYLDSSPLSGNSRERQGPKLPFHFVRRDQDKNFFARGHALKAIEEALCPTDATEKSVSKPPSFPRCFAVHGPGGMGKTQIAAQFVATHRGQFDAVFWVDAENSSKISQCFNEIATELGLIPKGCIDATDQSYTRDVVKSWLVNPFKNPEGANASSKEMASWLLVFDGVEQGDNLNDFWPYDGPGSILVTSRNPHSWTASLELKPFSTHEATQYLIKMTDRDTSDEEKVAAATIARRLGGLPLALAQMGAIIAHRSISFSEFLRSYEDRGGQQQFIQWNVDEVRPRLSNYEHNIASVWAFDSLGSGAKILLNVLSMLDPDWIPEHLFDTVATDSDHPDIVTLKKDYKAARNELLARSLITRNPREKALFIHRLVQDVTRMRMNVSKLRRVFFESVMLVYGRWPFEAFRWRHSVARWSGCAELLPHIERLKDVFPDVTPSLDSLEDYHFAKLLVDAGW